MLLLSHITIAILSLLFATRMAVRPSAKQVKASYVLAGLTLGTGTVLILTTGSALLQACASGIVYFSAMLVLIHIARTKLEQA